MDGLGYIEIGNTQEEAEAKVRAVFDREREAAIADSIAMGWPPEEPTLEECYALHSNEA